MNKKPIVPVVFATDGNYAPYCSVAIASLLAHRDPQREYDICVFCGKTDEDYCRTLEAMSQSGAKVRCVEVERYIDREKLQVHSYFSIATYYRIFTPEILPQYDKILYLDCDIVILQDVGALYDIEIGENYLAAAPDRSVTETDIPEYVNYVRDLGGGVTSKDYFNAGILVMNLAQFRKEGIGEKCMEYLGSHPKLRWLDQDTLNSVCFGHVCRLPEKWNKHQFYYDQEFHGGNENPEACIIHYIDKNKPWNSECHPAAVPFYRMSELSPYREEIFRKIQQTNCVFDTMAKRKVESGEAGLVCLMGLFRLWIKTKWKKLLHK